uniref:Uncharacterized protein n=1 Tax=Nothoprocta perdicaria TaxID=30464 RepID=A0A8C6YYB3_NOTPE
KRKDEINNKSSPKTLRIKEADCTSNIYNADTNHRCNRGWTALHEAVSRNDLEIIDILVKGGAKIESTNAYGITSLFVAAESGQLDALRYLAKCGEASGSQTSVQNSHICDCSERPL